MSQFSNYLEEFSESDNDSENSFSIEPIDVEQNPIVQNGFNVSIRTAGQIVQQELYTTMSILDAVPYNDFQESLLYALSRHNASRFRNLVVMIKAPDSLIHRHIALSRDRLMNLGNSSLQDIERLVNGARNALDLINSNNILEMFEDYETGIMRHNITYGNPIETFSLVTSYFAIVYDIPNNQAGGYVVHSTKTKYLKVENPHVFYGFNNCFFDCISYSLNSKVDPDRCREIMNCPKGPVQLRHIPKFERRYRVSVTIYADAVSNSEPIKIYNPTKSSDKSVELVLYNGHYYIYKGMLDYEENDNQELYSHDDQNFYIFYDFETFVDPETFIASPYAMSYVVVENGRVKTTGCILREKIEDLNAFYHKVHDFFNQYWDYARTNLIGYNNGAFDDYLLIDILTMFSKKLGKVLIDRTSRILRFNFKDMYSKDMYRFMLMSLKDATKSFQCNKQKGYIDHTIVQYQVQINNFDSWIKQNKDSVIQYAISDVESLMELYFKAENTFKSINPLLSMSNKLSLSQMSMHAFKSSLKKMSLPILSYEEDEIVRQALIGGRCQIFNACEESEHQVQSIDVVSLYPHVMMTKEYPYVGADDEDWFVPVDSFDQNYIGIYNITVINQPRDAIVPLKRADNTLDWTPSLPFTRWVDSVTLNCLDRYNGEYSVHSGYVFKLKTANIFKQYLGPIMEKKKEQDEHRTNPALRECLKLLMNSLSGKMAQRPITQEKTICASGPQADEIACKYTNKSTFVEVRDSLWLVDSVLDIDKIRVRSPTILAVLIYAYAREYMYDNFITKVTHKYGMDTDSLFLRKSELVNIDSKLFGTECGQVRTELPEDCYGIFAARKVYAYYKKDGTIVKFKFKGVNQNDRLINDHQIIAIQTLVKRRQWSKLTIIWNDLKPATSIDTLRKILRGDRVYILCLQLIRNFMGDVNTSLTISQRYIIKTFIGEASIEDLF